MAWFGLASMDMVWFSPGHHKHVMSHHHSTLIAFFFLDILVRFLLAICTVQFEGLWYGEKGEPA